MKIILVFLLSCATAFGQAWTVNDCSMLRSSQRQSYLEDFVSWNLNTNYLAHNILPSQTMTFGGPGVWDPATSLFRAYLHNNGDNKIYMITSSDGWVFNSGPVLVFSPASAGAWDDYRIGVPFVWYESGETRPWRMLYRGKQNPTNYQIGLATSLDGITWDREDTAGNALASSVVSFPTKDIDFGNVFKDSGTYYLYYSTITSPRCIFLATSTDLVNWTLYSSRKALFRGVQTVSTTWDYEDATHLASATNASAFGWYCPWVGRWDRPDGIKQFLFISPTMTFGNTSSNKLSCFTSLSPVFETNNRTYCGDSVNLLTNYTIMDAPNSVVSLDVPRIYCDDISQNPLTSTRIGQSLQMFLSVNSSTYGWLQGVANRPARLPVPTVGQSLSLSSCSGLFPSTNPVLRLDLSPYQASTVFQWCPGQTLQGYDMTGNGCNINNNLVSALSTVFINNNGAWLFGGNALGKFDTNKVTTQFSGVAQDFTFEFTLQKTNTIGSGTYYVFEIGGSGSPAYNTNKTYVLYNGNAGDTAVTFSMKLTDDSGTARTYNTPAFDWSDNARRSFAFSVTGGKIYWLTNGTLVNAGGTAFNYAMWQANYALAIGNKTNPTGSCIGYLDEIRYSSAGLYTGNYSVSALPLAYKTDGYAFTPVYDTYTTNAATIVYGGTIPAGCAVVPLHRLATSATDQSFSSGDFSSGTSFGRYHQWAIHLTGNGTSTPTVTQFSVRIL